MSGRTAMTFGVYAQLAGTVHAPGEARELISHALGDDHPQADQARLAISELVSNAIAHSRSGQPGATVIISFEASTRAADMCIHVRDMGGPDAPLLSAADAQ
jgi:anti-sigma regulatory factor (Ser/Thr protein kinase)